METSHQFVTAECLYSADKTQDYDENVHPVLRQEDDFMASFDMKDVYFQISFHQESRKYFCFILEGVVYQFEAMCCGLLVMPQEIT